MITFLAAVYNEEEEIRDLIYSLDRYVDRFAICDDGSTDKTSDILTDLWKDIDSFRFKTIDHTGLPETVKNEALSLVPDKSWVLMLDADERVTANVLNDIRNTLNNDPEYDYFYCRQLEFIDGILVREYQKCKVFRKEAITFPLHNIHADDQFIGKGMYKPQWTVVHRKSSTKQIVRESEYLDTYKKLLDEGSIDKGRYDWLVGLHHFVKEG